METITIEIPDSITKKEELADDGMYKLMQEVNFSEKVSLETVFRKLRH